MYSDVAKSLFYWTEPDTADPEKVHTLVDTSKGLYFQTKTVAQEEEERSPRQLTLYGENISLKHLY
jgi:hypothetical protein